MLMDSATAGGVQGGRRRRRDRKIITKVSNVPESHFYGAIAGVDPFENLSGSLAKRKVGRPFKGEVEEFTKEPHVPERRSILRGFKKFYAKKEFDDILGLRYRPPSSTADGGVQGDQLTFMSDIYHGLERNDLQNVQRYMDICRNTQSADHYRKKTAGNASPPGDGR